MSRRHASDDDSESRDVDRDVDRNVDGDVRGDGGSDDESAHLPPVISAETNATPWWVIAGATTAVLCVAWIAGASALAPIETTGDAPGAGAAAVQLGIGARFAGVARTLVFLPLASLALVFGVLALAFVRQRPIGDVVGLFAKCSAIVGVAMLVRLAPVDTRFVKATLDHAGPAVIALLLLVPFFRLHPRDAALATGFALLGLVLLTLSAFVIVWATSM